MNETLEAPSFSLYDAPASPQAKARESEHFTTFMQGVAFLSSPLLPPPKNEVVGLALFYICHWYRLRPTIGIWLYVVAMTSLWTAIEGGRREPRPAETKSFDTPEDKKYPVALTRCTSNEILQVHLSKQKKHNTSKQ